MRSKYGMDGRLLSSSSSSSSLSSAEAKKEKTKGGDGGAYLAAAFSDPFTAGVTTVTLLTVVTVALFPHRYSLYTGLAAFTGLAGLVLYKLHEQRVGRQASIDGLTRIAKDLLRVSHRGGPFPVGYLLEEIIEMAEDKKFPTNTSTVVKGLTLAQIKELWSDVCTNVLSDSRVNQATMDYQGASKLQTWKFAGSDGASTSPFAFGGARSASPRPAPYVARTGLGR